jgi:hypothetical protein
MGGASREAMRREFSAIGALAAAISFLAAAVLCTELSQTRIFSGWQPTAPAQWTLELALFGVAVLVWRGDVSLGGWMVGIVALAAARAALSATCAVALTELHPGFSFGRALQQASGCEPRLAAAVFSVLVCYPLRGLLPAGKREGRRSPAEGREKEEARGDASLWIVRGEEKLQVLLSPAGERASAGGRREAPTAVVTIASPEQIPGSITLPLSSVLPRIPQDDVSRLASEYPPDHPVSIPLFLIVPQLKEAQIFVRLEEMQRLLPSGVLVTQPDGGPQGEPLLVSLALADVVPALPAEVLELPPPSPPAWADLPDPESVVFATV